MREESDPCARQSGSGQAAILAAGDSGGWADERVPPWWLPRMLTGRWQTCDQNAADQPLSQIYPRCRTETARATAGHCTRAGATGGGVGLLHVGGAIVQYAQPSASRSPPSWSRPPLVRCVQYVRSCVRGRRRTGCVRRRRRNGRVGGRNVVTPCRPPASSPSRSRP